MMTSRLDRVTESFSEKSLAVVDLMIGRSQELTDAIIETSSQLAETIATRADEVNSTLKSSGESLILDLDLRGGEVATKLQESGNQHHRGAHCAHFDDDRRGPRERRTCRGRHRARAATRCKEMLATRLAAFEEMFNHTGAELGEKISRDSSTLGQSHHPASRRIRSHREDLRLGTRRAARRAHAGRFRVDAQLRRQFRQSRHLQGERGHHRPRPAPGALPGGARQPLADADGRAVRARRGHRQDARRRRQGGRHRRSTSASPTSPRSSIRAPPSSPTPSASGLPTIDADSRQGRA